jgi:hypothetical protein
MKKITTIIVSLRTLTVLGATVYYLGRIEKLKEKFAPTKAGNSIVQKVQIAENSKVKLQTNKINTSKKNEKKDCFTYECAYLEYLAMLEEEKNLDFKRAVFIYENTYQKGKLSYENFSNHFSELAIKLNDFIIKKGISNYKTAGQYAIFSFMYEPSELNNYEIFKYDFDDFLGDKDWTNMFVTKVMRTKTGNCHGMPYFYKILSNELGVESFLAIAPSHMYIKHIDEKGKWVNIELTNGHISTDAWVISSMGISAEAIKKGIYMDALTEKQSVALCLWDLAMSYEREYGYDEFVLKCCNTVIKHYPTSITALMTKQNCLQAIGKKQQEDAKRKGIVITTEIENIHKEYQVLHKQIKELGYREMPQDLYERWINSVEEEKQNSSKQN